MEILFLLIGLAVGAMLGFMLVYAKKKAVDAQLMLIGQQLGQASDARTVALAQLEAANKEKRALSDELTNVKMALSGVQAQLESEQVQNSKESELRREQFQEQLRTVQEQFANLATRVLDQTSDRLKNQNSESLENITRPLKQHIEQLHQAIQTTNSETARNTASLSQQLKEMAARTDKIDDTATRLTNVIRGANKAQGNWGEFILTDILDAQGLKIGINYDVQQTITDEKGNAVINEETGKRMIPDVILHYPNNEDVVIDSKMSIEAYYQYVNTENEALKKQYAADLVRSIRTQYMNLAKKDYSKYIRKPRHAIDFVIMFVPNEGALQLALATEPTLWNDAFNRQVFITSQQNLMAILKMIEIAWRQYVQTENQKKVFDMAEEMLKRVGAFVKLFEKVGTDIEALHKHYDEVYKKAFTGRQSIVQKANELKELGVKETSGNEIPRMPPELDVNEILNE
ncbi:MAG: DNA recombination protein RmuC [Prevotella sp.]|nr:DNA recombination protein RmuC [Prevotella sp.]MDY4040054.1 DNA recombination protein RmuC [Prevotella sp.]